MKPVRYILKKFGNYRIVGTKEGDDSFSVEHCEYDQMGNESWVTNGYVTKEGPKQWVWFLLEELKLEQGDKR